MSVGLVIRHVVVAVAASVASLSAAVEAKAATATFIPSNGAWEVPGNWTIGLVPRAGDTVVITGNTTSISINAPTNALSGLTSAATNLIVNSTLTVNGPAVFNGGLLLNGELAGTGTFTLNASGSWSAGRISSPFKVNATNVFTIMSSPTKTIAGATFENFGTVAWTNGTIVLDGNVAITNAPGAVWDVQDLLTMTGNANGNESFNNSGRFQRTGPLGAGSVTAAVSFVNSGTVAIRLGGPGAGQFDQWTIGTVAFAGTLEVTAVNGFSPPFRGTFDIIGYATRIGTFAQLTGSAASYNTTYGPTSLSITNLNATPGAEMMRNGGFSTGTSFWTTFATPDMSYIVANGTGGTMDFYRLPPPAGTTNQAVVFQTTDAKVYADAPLRAQFDLQNTGTTRKRISVLLLDSDFSDLSVCTFWLPPSAPVRTYAIRTHTTKAWNNAAIYFYAASTVGSGGAYRIDNVSLQTDGSVAPHLTACEDPTAPATTGQPVGVELLVNGTFDIGAPGTLDPWGLFGQITQQVTSGVFEFYRPAGVPAGVLLQATGQALTANTLVTAEFQLGNSSGVRKRVTVILHDNNFSDLQACTFWIPPGQPLSDYKVRTFATQAWTNATVSFYPATVDTQPWIRLDNVGFRKTPSTATSGADCLEPGQADARAPATPRAETSESD